MQFAGPLILNRAALVVLCLAAVAAPRNRAWGQAPPDRQRSVEQGLLQEVTISGEDIPRYTIHERMHRYAVPGVGIAVIAEGKIDWAAGYGVKRAGGSDSITVETLFQAASISKSVAAAGMLQLVDAGTLSLDEDIARSLRSWRIPENPFTRKQPITLRRLLSHTAGTNVHGFPGYTRGANVPTTVVVLSGGGNTPAIVPDTLPGSIWRYSGGGFTVAQLLVEDVTRRPFAEAMHASVLAPLGMDRSTFKQPLSDDRSHEAAAGHGWDGDLIEGSWRSYPEQAAAGLWTTPSDLARFAIGVSEAYRGEPGAFLSQELAREMLTPVMEDYGLGVGVVGSGSTLRFSHGGANAGYRCFFVMYPERGQGVVVMTNAEGGADLTSEVMRAVSDVYGWPDFKPEQRPRISLTPADLQAFAGEYQIEGDTRISIWVEGDALTATANRRFPPELYPESADVFFGTEVKMRIRFERDAAGDVIGFSILRPAGNIAAVRIQ